MKSYKLIGPDGKPYESTVPGTLGGHRRSKGYGRLDCSCALRWIARGYYVKHRVFFADEAAAIAAGYRPCAVCMRARYVVWKQARAQADTRQQALEIYGTLLNQKIATRHLEIRLPESGLERCPGCHPE